MFSRRVNAHSFNSTYAGTPRPPWFADIGLVAPENEPLPSVTTIKKTSTNVLVQHTLITEQILVKQQPLRSGLDRLLDLRAERQKVLTPRRELTRIPRYNHKVRIRRQINRRPDGRLHPIRGTLPATLAAQQTGFTRVIVPLRQSGEAKLDVFGIASIT